MDLIACVVLTTNDFACAILTISSHFWYLLRCIPLRFIVYYKRGRNVTFLSYVILVATIKLVKTICMITDTTRLIRKSN